MKGYLLAVVTFSVLHWLLTFFSNALVGSTDNWKTTLMWLNLLAYSLYLVAGLTAAAVARRKPMLHGSVAGVLAATAAILIFGVSYGELYGKIFMLLSGAVIGGLGGAILLVPGWVGKGAL
jgi:hypothetical protein